MKKNILSPYDTEISFQLKTMETIYETEKGMPNKPHRHNYYAIIWPRKSVPGKRRIDFNEYPIEKEKLFFIQPGQIHQLAAENKPRGYVIIFSPDFLNRSKIDKKFIDGLKVFNSFLYNEPLPITKEKAEKLQKIIDSISENLNLTSRYHDEILGAYLKIFLIECTSVCGANIEIDKNKSKFIVEEFKTLVEKHFKKEHQVKFYAARLVISSGHLNNTLKNEIGINAKKYIKDRITLEAKRLLLFSGLTAKEIAFQIGFKDPHHFSKFIKSNTGLSISLILNQHEKDPV